MSEPARPEPRHRSVMPTEVLQVLQPAPGEIVVDCTLGGGGHTRLLAERVAPGGRVIALDRDPAMLALARSTLEGLPVTFMHACFDQLPEVLRQLNLTAVDGVLADLGISSDQLDAGERGFSFQREAVLDMRMDQSMGQTAADLLRRCPEEELADIFYLYGEERHSRRIARRIVELRERQPLETTLQLAELIRRCVPRPSPRQRQTIDPATRVFQALRIAVNDELSVLEGLLQVLPRCVNRGGRVAILSFHSLEDRRVKQAFRNPEVWELITRKPLQASDDETTQNPRSRSAKLRAARRRGASSEGNS